MYICFNEYKRQEFPEDISRITGGPINTIYKATSLIRICICHTHKLLKSVTGSVDMNLYVNFKVTIFFAGIFQIRPLYSVCYTAWMKLLQ